MFTKPAKGKRFRITTKKTKETPSDNVEWNMGNASFRFGLLVNDPNTVTNHFAITSDLNFKLMAYEKSLKFHFIC